MANFEFNFEFNDHHFTVNIYVRKNGQQPPRSNSTMTNRINNFNRSSIFNRAVQLKPKAASKKAVSAKVSPRKGGESAAALQQPSTAAVAAAVASITAVASAAMAQTVPKEAAAPTPSVSKQSLQPTAQPYVPRAERQVVRKTTSVANGTSAMAQQPSVKTAQASPKQAVQAPTPSAAAAKKAVPSPKQPLLPAPTPATVAPTVAPKQAEAAKPAEESPSKLVKPFLPSSRYDAMASTKYIQMLQEKEAEFSHIGDVTAKWDRVYCKMTPSMRDYAKNGAEAQLWFEDLFESYIIVLQKSTNMKNAQSWPLFGVMANAVFSSFTEEDYLVFELTKSLCQRSGR